MADVRATLHVSNIPHTAVAAELFDYFDASVGSVYACKIATARRNWKSKGFGRVQFDTFAAAERARLLDDEGRLPLFQHARLTVSPSHNDIVVRASEGQNRLEAAALHAGVLVGEGHMEIFEAWEQVRVEIMPERKKLELFVDYGGEKYKLEVLFGDILESSSCCLDGRESILLQLQYAPRCFVRIHGLEKESNDRFRVCREDIQFLWVRTTDFSPNGSIGKSFYYCLQLSDGLSCAEILRKLPFSRALGELILSKRKSSSSSSLVSFNCLGDCSVPYEILYQINSLVHMQKITFRQVTIDLFDILKGLPSDVAIKILMKMHKLVSTCYDPVQFIKDELSRIKRSSTSPFSKSIIAQNMMSCYRVLVTPSRIYCLGPELEKSNYVVKHFSAHASDFLRVTFVDEDWSKLPSDAISAKIDSGVFSEPFRTAIYTRILSILRDGLPICSKKFEFLAFSASQLRSNSVWMFASNDNLTAESIRKWMGHFNGIRSVSKCAARMGQLFSSSMQTMNVPPPDVKIIPDVEITTEDGKKYCFSDGIGKISLPFARQIAQKCGLSNTPSAFQIRYGGYKGVIVSDRKSFWKLSLRRSMLKFESANTMLSVTKWSEYQPCFLNREIVCLLSTLGVKDEIFESMQHDQMQLLDKMLTDTEIALRVLDTLSGPDIRTAVKMLIQGYKPNSEPYLLMMLKAHREYQLLDIRSKCRIFVPKGRVLIGCLDETSVLDYGQVYIKVTMTKEELQKENTNFIKNADQITATIVGKVLVTKNPCLHPGDIRVLQAVYDPLIDYLGLVDCLIFPQKGKRPHPNECSGGDLDGDLYFVCWDENLIPPETDAPMDYTPTRPRIMDHDVKLEEIQKYFVNYMINDNLGAISTTHLVYADSEPSKARCSKCLELANLHSMAVDFAKTGAPAEMPRALRPKIFPDFMERFEKPMFNSPGVIGKLYRAASSYHEDLNSETITSQCVYDYDLLVEGFEAFLGAAEEYYSRYAEKLGSLMNYYGAEHEDEILTGNLRNKSAYLQKDRKRYGEMKDRMLIGVKNLKEEVDGWFKCSCPEKDLFKMASAWYQVTYHPDYRPETRFLSFPWIVSDVLLRIKAARARKS
ncbi:probable RNA-dependent RNA polymerase 2 [Zingiber officinale]|uniref:probable RNA-dependent RNA polymerase 2 n=1 Tax=Zingiber officinale TaxID=94328 RepID=UPI001C4C5497|nr:probable RNA-dependent RNA polymerase 2 [Zingiber officinale]